MTRLEPCLLCGATISADDERPTEVMDAVLVHVRTERHRLAQGRMTKPCPDCRMVTIPAWRDRCHGCTRSALVAA